MISTLSIQCESPPPQSMKTIHPFLPASVLPSRARRHLPLICSASIAFLAAAQTIHAADQTWTGGGIDGNWATAGNWAGNAAPGAATGSISNDTATFNNNVNTNVTIASGRNIKSIIFDLATVGAFTFSGGPLTITNGGTITINSADANSETFNNSFLGSPNATATAYSFVNNSGTVGANLNLTGNITGQMTASTETFTFGGSNNGTMSGVIGNGSGGGTVAVTKSGAGTWTLSGADTYTGATTVSAGTLKLDFSAGGSITGSALKLGGGTLQIVGASGGSTETFTSTSFTAATGGQSVISAAPVSGTIPTVNLGTLTGTQGALVRFDGAAYNSGASSGTTLGGTTVAATATFNTTTNSLAGGIITNSTAGSGCGAYVTVGLYDWAAISTGVAGTAQSGNIVGLSQISGGYTVVNTLGTGLFGGNYDLTANAQVGGGSTSISGGIGTIRINTNAAITLTAGRATGNSVLGALLITPNVGANNTTIALGNGVPLQASRSTNGATGFTVWQNNTLGELLFNSGYQNGSSSAATGSYTQGGPGTVVMGASNTYTGLTFLDGGTTAISANNNLGAEATAASINMNGGSILSTASIALDNGTNFRQINLNGAGGGLSAANTFTLTMNGVVAGSGSLTIGSGTLAGTGAGTANTTAVIGSGTVALTGSNTYSGGTTLKNGTAQIKGINNLGTGNYGGLTFNGGTLQYAPSATGFGSLDLSSGNGILLSSGGGTVDVNGNSVTYANAISGSAALTVKSTAANGVLNLQAANTYTGGTTVSSGTLKVTNSTGSATGSGNVSLGAAATLTGAGIITGGTVTTGATSIITPGTVTAGSAGSGILTLGSNLTLTAGTAINYGLVQGTATANYISTGTLTLPGSGTVVLDLYAPNTITPFAAAGTYDLFQYTTLAGGALSTAFSFGTSITGFTPSFATLGGFVQLTLTATGVSGTWTNNGGIGTGNWNDSLNWSGGIPSLAGSSAIFGAAAPGTVTLDASKTVGGISFNNATGFNIVGGNTLTLDNNAGGVAVTVVTGSHSIQTAVAFNDNVTVTPAGGTQLSISGNITQASGSSSLTMSGAGTLVLSGSNSYTGGTSVSNGVLNFNSLSALGTGTTLSLGGTSTNGTLKYAGGNTADISTLTVTINAGGGTIDTNGNDVVFGNLIGNGGAGGLTKAGAGKLTLAAGNTYSGPNVLSVGTLTISADTSLGVAPGAAVANLTLAAGTTLQAAGAFTLVANRGVVMSGGTATIDTNGNNVTIAGNISGSGLFKKISTGNLTLTGANSGTATGGITIDDGTVFINGIGNLPGGTITLNGTAGISNGTNAVNFNNVVVNGTNALTKTGTNNILGLGTTTGSGTVTLSNSYVTDLTGNLTAFTGTIKIVGAGPRLNGTTGGTNLTLDLQGSGASVRSLTGGVITIGQLLGTGGGLYGGGGGFTGAVTYSIGSKTVAAVPVDSNFAGVIQNGASPNVSLTKTGNSVLTLSGANTYTGTTIINAGTVDVAGGATGTTGADIQIAPGNGLTGALTVETGATVNAARMIIAGNTANSVTGTMAGSLTQIGGTINSAAWFTVGSGNAAASTGASGAFTMTGGILNVLNTGGGTQMEIGNFAGTTGVVTMSGASAINIQNNAYIALGANDNAASGTFTQNGGTVTFYSDAGVTVGGTGKLMIGAAAVNSGTFSYDLNGGVLNVPQIATAGGTSQFNFNGGTLKPTGSTATFLQGLTTANVRNGGARIDTNGFDVTVGQDLLHSAIGGDNATDGGLTKTGNGALTLNGANTYSGATAVSVGTLVAGNAAALGTAGAGTTVASGATLDVRANIGAEAISVSGTGVGGNGALVTGAGTGTVGGTVTMTANTSIGGAGMLNVTGAINGAFTLTTVGAGTTTLSGAQTYSTLTTGAGLTNVNSAVGTGSSTINATATTHINASQTLAALNIADGVEVTFGDGLPFVGGAEKFGAPALVPEPGSMGLMLVGALGLLGRRRRS